MKSKVLAEALKWDGYLEKKSNSQLEDFTANAGSNNYTIFAKWYRDWWGDNFQAQPWCAMFVSCVFRLALGAAVQGRIMPHFAYCPTGVNQFKKLGVWHTGTPKPGDVIFFKDSGGTACHVGIVTVVGSSVVHTIEGNTSGASGVVPNGGGVVRKSYALTYSRIMGYGRPKYESEGLTMEQYNELKKMIAAITPMIYNYIDDNMPAWARPTVQKMANKGLLKGNEQGELRLTEELMRVFVVLDRAGVFGE